MRAWLCLHKEVATKTPKKWSDDALRRLTIFGGGDARSPVKLQKDALYYGLIVINNPKNYYKLFLKDYEILANNHKYRFGNSRIFHAIDAIVSPSG